MQRTLNIETTKYIGKKVKVAGWVDVRRDHGKIIFIDLRDISGLLQVVFTPKNDEIYKIAQGLRPEWVISIEGTVQERPKQMVNPKLPTGQIELQAEKLEVLSKAKTLPFEINERKEAVGEDIRMKYRYLDLRREKMKNNLILRHKAINEMRSFLTKEGFIEVETPILTKSTPEGARDFIVPSRLQPGKFYALPQSPQQYKQLLMVAGLEKYFQISRCFRDEDPRADRQAEFTQLDIEISFVEQEDILNLIERLYVEIVKKILPEKKIQTVPFPRLTYKEAMEKYKTDKPDLRKDKNNPDELAFAFVVDFPMFEWKKEEKRWDAVHHPFTRPQTEDIKELKKNPKNILAYQYDFVLNGYEIGGGSLRSFK
ncbi:MAG: aspartate--tRNA ligase, partial [Candidatus Nealsonbacteria bacterium]|nr:aspartate--tRNA ligase [Candidatus Nealsonbacteria bacterium]